MKKISPVFSHINLKNKKNSSKKVKWAKPVKVEEIAKSKPKFVKTYDELVMNVAQILHRNRNYTLYYRGQSGDFKNNNRQTTILPSIYRKSNREKRLMLKERFDDLSEKVGSLRTAFRNSTIKYTGTLMLNKYPEISWSLLQHYEVCPTPLLDITHSLHVACSFAFDKNVGNSGIIYVLGMPWQTDAMGYNAYDELVNLRLLSVCPPQAQRPFFQEGYLSGPFPNYQLDNPNRVIQFDFARRLIAKFEIPINVGFWGNGFDKIPSGKLYQKNDKIAKLLKGI